MQGWQVSPLRGNKHGNYPVSAIRRKYFLPRGEMAEREETKFGENCYENTQLIETLTG